MRAEDAIMEALRAHPALTQRELCEVTGYTARHIRRVLPTLPITSHRHGRSILYSITTTGEDTRHAGETPDIPDARRRLDDLTSLHAQNTGHVRCPTPDIADMPDMTPDIPTNRAASAKQSKKNRSNTGHFQVTTPDIPDIDTRHTGHYDPEPSPSRPPIRERPPTMHREPLDRGAGAAPYAECPPDCTDHACRSCPLSIASLERDTVQFVLVDQTFRDQVIRWVASRKWPHKEGRGIVWVYPGDHLTLQVGADSVVFYSDEPGDLQWIEAWVRRHFEGIYPDIDGLLARIRSPERLTRDELTVVVTHQPTIDAVMASVGMHMGPNKTFYLKAPNSNTPGFKAYQHAGTLRMEFDCRNQFQAISALDMRQRLLTILPEVQRAEGLFWEFLTDYYNPYEHPIVIDTGIDSIVQQISEMATSMSETFAAALAEALKDIKQQAPPPEKHVASEPDPTVEEEEQITGSLGAMRAMMQALSEMDTFELDEILRTFRETLKLEERAVRVYLAAFAAWAQKTFRGSVILEDLIPILENAGTPLSAAEIADAIADLKRVGLLQDHPTLEICFSPFGSRLGRKLVAKWRGV